VHDSTKTFTQKTGHCPTVKAAKDWYYSEAYKSVAKHRQKGAIYQGLIVAGIA
jgi:uncharacterized protein (DUF1330 family)